jgi:enoyl-CoA hydratase/carnithine racemase
MRLRLAIVDERGGSSLTPRLVASLHAALRAESDARIVTLEGGPAAFCTGLNTDALPTPELPQDPSESRALLDRFVMLLDAIERTPVPVLALIDGPVLGGGVGLAAAADLALATPRATFGLPEALLGLIPAMVFPVLARRVGVPRARWIALGAATLSADEAFRVGLVDQVCDDLEGTLERYTRRFIRMDSRALAEIKLLVAEHFCVHDGYRADAAARFGRLLGNPDTRERLARFADGEAPWHEDTRHESHATPDHPPPAAGPP